VTNLETYGTTFPRPGTLINGCNWEEPASQKWPKTDIMYTYLHPARVSVVAKALIVPVVAVANLQQAIHNFLNTCEKHSYFLKASKCEIMQPQIMLLWKKP
jgi:hypothetical protein